MYQLGYSFDTYLGTSSTAAMYPRIFAVCLVFAGGILAHRHDARSSLAPEPAAGPQPESPLHSLPDSVRSRGIPIPKDETTERNQSLTPCGKQYGSCEDGLCCSARGEVFANQSGPPVANAVL